MRPILSWSSSSQRTRTSESSIIRNGSRLIYGSDAMVLGFQLLCVLVNAFGPSGEFATFVASFLQRNLEDKADGIGVMAKCLDRPRIES